MYFTCTFIRFDHRYRFAPPFCSCKPCYKGPQYTNKIFLSVPYIKFGIDVILFLRPGLYGRVSLFVEDKIMFELESRLAYILNHNNIGQVDFLVLVP